MCKKIKGTPVLLRTLLEKKTLADNLPHLGGVPGDQP